MYSIFDRIDTIELNENENLIVHDLESTLESGLLTCREWIDVSEKVHAFLQREYAFTATYAEKYIASAENGNKSKLDVALNLSNRALEAVRLAETYCPFMSEFPFPDHVVEEGEHYTLNYNYIAKLQARIMGLIEPES